VVSDGEKVKVCGTLHYRFEDNNLYNINQKLNGNNSCLSVGVSEKLTKKLSSLDGKKVDIIGRYTNAFCPDGDICQASCSKAGIFIDEIDAL
jgi:hypothetical protein